MRDISGPKITLLNGRYFDFENMSPDDFTLHDIAHALAHQSRFNGYCTGYYSIAEHSVNVAKLVEKQHRLQALLHDATEAFVSDMCKPLKDMPELEGYKHVERQVRGVICDKFGLDVILPENVKHADKLMLAYEQKHAMKNHDVWTYTQDIDVNHSLFDVVSVQFMSPAQAKFEFLMAYAELT